jgi:hypothetical protein
LRLDRGRRDRGDDLAGPHQVGLTGGGELDASRRTPEQLQAELGLQLADLLGQRRLSHV